MNKEEKIGFWFIINLISNKVNPKIYHILNKKDKKNFLTHYYNVLDYLKRGEKIPSKVLSLIKNKTNLDYFRKYVRDISEMMETESKINKYEFEHDKGILILLFEEIEKSNEFTFQKEEEKSEVINDIEERERERNELILRRFVSDGMELTNNRSCNRCSKK